MISFFSVFFIKSWFSVLGMISFCPKSEIFNRYDQFYDDRVFNPLFHKIGMISFTCENTVFNRYDQFSCLISLH